MTDAVKGRLRNPSPSGAVAYPRPGRTSEDVDLVSLIVRRSLFETVDLRALADEFACTERAIRVAFQRAYGMSPRTYKRRTKVLCAIELLRKETWDNDSVARELGFRSPKNLYRALRLETGLTPRQIRLLSESDLVRLRSRIAPGQTPPDGTSVRASALENHNPAKKRRSFRRSSEGSLRQASAVLAASPPCSTIASSSVLARPSCRYGPTLRDNPHNGAVRNSCPDALPSAMPSANAGPMSCSRRSV